MDHEDIIDRILDGLDKSYDAFVEKINYRDSPISFEVFHEKLINKELAFLHHESHILSKSPITIFATTSRYWNKTTTTLSPTSHSFHSNSSTASPNRVLKPFYRQVSLVGECGHMLYQYATFIYRFLIVI